MGKKSFRVLLNTQKLSKNMYEFIKEIEAITQVENGQFVYDEKDEEKLKGIINKFLPSENK